MFEEKEKSRNIEEVFGSSGKYQYFVYSLLILPNFIFGTQVMMFSWTGIVPESRCCIRSQETTCSNSNFSSEIFLDETQKKLWFGDSKEGKALCNYCTEFHNETKCSEYSKCQEHIFNEEKYRSSLAIEYKMICDDEWKGEVARSIFMLGFLIGASVFGYLSDRFGRRKSLLLAAPLTIVLTNIFPLVVRINYWLLCLMQYLIGMIVIGAGMNCFTLLMECTSGRTRTILGIWVQGLFTIGYMYDGLIAFLVNNDWRWIHWAASLPTLLLISYYWVFPESIRWLVLKGRLDEAEEGLVVAARMNGKNFPREEIRQIVESQHQRESSRPGEAGNILDLFRHRTLAKNTLICFFTWFVCSLTYYGLSQNTADLPFNDYISYILSGALELPGYALCIPLMERCGRKITLTTTLGLGGVFCVVSGLLEIGGGAEKRGIAITIVILALAGKMLVAAAFAVLYNYTAEIFPTVIRNSASGLSSTLAHVGSISAAGFHAIGSYTELPWIPIVIYGGFGVIAATLSLLLPETKDRLLPETIDDAIRMSRRDEK